MAWTLKNSKPSFEWRNPTLAAHGRLNAVHEVVKKERTFRPSRRLSRIQASLCSDKDIEGHRWCHVFPVRQPMRGEVRKQEMHNLHKLPQVSR
jgi:hypothetical protein